MRLNSSKFAYIWSLTLQKILYTQYYHYQYSLKLTFCGKFPTRLHILCVVYEKPSIWYGQFPEEKNSHSVENFSRKTSLCQSVGTFLLKENLHFLAFLLEALHSDDALFSKETAVWCVSGEPWHSLKRKDFSFINSSFCGNLPICEEICMCGKPFQAKLYLQ